MLTKTDNTTLSFATDPAEISRRLQEPFASSEVKFRIGARNRDKTKGIALAYIDARNVQNRLDEVVGCANWKLEFVELPDAIKCRLSLRINGEWITKEDVSSIERVGENAGADAVDMAKKGDHSDAFKRAAVQWGIGRYLYGYDSGWLELKNEGRYFAQQPRLPDHMLPAHERKSANKPAPPAWRSRKPLQRQTLGRQLRPRGRQTQRRVLLRRSRSLPLSSLRLVLRSCLAIAGQRFLRSISVRRCT